MIGVSQNLPSNPNSQLQVSNWEQVPWVKQTFGFVWFTPLQLQNSHWIPEYPSIQTQLFCSKQTPFPEQTVESSADLP